MYKDGDVSPCGLTMNDVTLTSLWQQCKKDSEFEKRSSDVAKFNRLCQKVFVHRFQIMIYIFINIGATIAKIPQCLVFRSFQHK